MDRIEDLVREHGAALHAYVTRLTGGDHHAAEDVVQETWLRAWRNVDRLTDNRGSVRGWLMRVGHNVAMDQHRARRARPSEVGLPEQGFEHPAVAPFDDEVETRVVVDTLLDGLSPLHRATLVQVYFADRTATTAARVLGVPRGTVKSRVHIALHRLRAAISGPPSEALSKAA
jgi:RNA polymerase sigma-70 factor (ECF subfamily)